MLTYLFRKINHYDLVTWFSLAETPAWSARGDETQRYQLQTYLQESPVELNNKIKCLKEEKSSSFYIFKYNEFYIFKYNEFYS